MSLVRDLSFLVALSACAVICLVSSVDPCSDCLYEEGGLAPGQSAAIPITTADATAMTAFVESTRGQLEVLVVGRTGTLCVSGTLGRSSTECGFTLPANGRATLVLVNSGRGPLDYTALVGEP